MKKILITLSLIIASYNIALTQSITSPITYFDYFNSRHGAIVQQNLSYLQVMVHSDDLKQVTLKRLELLQLIIQVEEELIVLPDYEKDEGLKVALQDVLAIYKNLYQGAYLEIEALKPTAQHSFSLMESYMQQQSAAETKLAKASRHFLDAQRVFAKANNIVIIEGQQNSETEQLNELNEYQRLLFISSFHVSKLNAQFLDGMRELNEEGLVKHLNDLLEACEEELDKLQKVPSFNENTAYRDAVLRQAKAIQALAKSDYPVLIKGATSPNALTPEEADKYNVVIGKINTTLGPLMEDINMSLRDLLKSNVPKLAHRGVKEI